jgi:hypothetical protein
VVLAAGAGGREEGFTRRRGGAEERRAAHRGRACPGALRFSVWTVRAPPLSFSREDAKAQRRPAGREVRRSSFRLALLSGLRPISLFPSLPSRLRVRHGGARARAAVVEKARRGSARDQPF